LLRGVSVSLKAVLMKVVLKLGLLNGMWNDGLEKMMRGWWRG
jgi:hypothetical protein